jgi:TPR repeat protein
LEYVDAQLKLGDWYTHGLNVPVDLVEAHRYYEKASGNGSV